MDLTVLGCAGTFPGPTSGCSSYLVEHDGFRLLVDAGPGAVSALQRHTDLLGVDAVLLSHLHADHCLDLVGYAYARYFHPGGRPPRLPVHGPAGTAARLTAAVGSSNQGFLDEVYDWRTVDGTAERIGPFALSFVRTNHPVECWAPRLEAGGAVLAYTGDTGRCDELVDLAQGADLLLAEASFLDRAGNPEGVHLCGRDAGEYAAKAGARSLLLTHLVAWNEPAATLAEAAAVYDGDLALAEAGRTYPVGPAR